MDEELEYISSIESTRATVDIVPQDEADLPVLKAVLRDINEGIIHHQTIASLSLDNKSFTIEQQLAVNQAIVIYLQGFKMAVEKVIEDIGEKYNG